MIIVIGDYLQVLIIEVNTVPGMTPSTVLIHQVLTIILIYLIHLFQRNLNMITVPQISLLIKKIVQEKPSANSDHYEN